MSDTSLENVLILGRHFVNVRPNQSYDYLGDTILGSELLKMDFKHITYWIDQKILTTEIGRWFRIPVCYHPEVHASLLDEQEESPYWGIDIYDQMKVFKRMRHKYTAEKLRAKEMMAEVDLTQPAMRNKLTNTRNKIVNELYIEREIAAQYLRECIEHFGTGLMNYRVPEIVKKIIDYKRL